MKSRALVVITALGASGCSFAPSNGAVGGDGHQPPDTSGSAGRDANPDAPVGTEATIPVDALPILPDAPPGSCMARWRSGTPPQFGTAASLFISAADSTQRDPTFSPDERTLYFASNLTTTKTEYWFVSIGAGGTVSSSPVPSDALGSGAIGNDGEGKMTMDAAFTDVFFASDRGGTDGLWHTHRGTSGPFGTPDQAGLAAVNLAGTHLADPQLAGGGLHLYYASDDGNRTQHIYMATRSDPTAAWGPGVPFTMNLDSMHGDADPSLSVDESTILFSSQRPGGVGGTDIYYATRESAGGNFGPVQPVPGVNTTKDEGDPVLSKDGCSIVFATDRNGTSALDYDIWAIDMTNPS